MKNFVAVLWHVPTGQVIETVIDDTAENEDTIREHWLALGQDFSYKWYNLFPFFRKEALPLSIWEKLVEYIEKHGGWKEDTNIWEWLDVAFIGRV